MIKLGKKPKQPVGVKRIMVAVVLFITSCLLIVMYIKSPPDANFLGGAFGIGIILSVIWALYLIWFSKVCAKKKR